jgi:hypothetical protein
VVAVVVRKDKMVHLVVQVVAAAFLVVLAQQEHQDKETLAEITAAYTVAVVVVALPQ